MMPKIMRSVMTVMTIGLIAVAKQSLATEPILVIYTDNEANVKDVGAKSGSLTKEPEKMPIGIEGLRHFATLNLNFAHVLGVDGTLAWCRPCHGDWCPVDDEELRYVIDDTAEDIRVQARVADKWLDLQSDQLSSYIWEEPTPAVAKILSLKSHTIMVLQDKEGNRHGFIISGITASAEEGAGPAPSIWFDPKVFPQ
jgi:hypothetical protein